MSEMGVVAQVWRHPVKSLQGEQVGATVVGPRGLVGDRTWAVRDVRSRAVLSAKREPRLLLASARAAGEGVEVTVPGGAPVSGAAADLVLSELLGRPVTVDVAPADGPAFVDEADLHMLTVSALGCWDVRRFRPNLLLDTDLDLDELVGSRIRLGGVTAEVSKRTKRCAMTTAEQPGIPKDTDVLRALARDHELRQGVYARVVTSGRVGAGDGVELL